MKLKFTAVAVFSVLGFLFALPAERNGTGIGPFQEEAVADDAFSLDGGLFSLGIIRECLGSFQKLTAEAAGKIPAAKLKEIGHTDWEMQTLGLANHPGLVEGALLRQEYEIRMLRWELVRLKAGSGAAGEEELKAAREALDASQRAFEEFKAKFRPKD